LYGDGVDESFTAGFATPWDAQFIGVSGGTNDGGPFWDDVYAATDSETSTDATTWGRIKSIYRR
jgi:hypothetical protein